MRYCVKVIYSPVNFNLSTPCQSLRGSITNSMEKYGKSGIQEKKDKESKMEEAENNKAILFQSDKSTIGKKRFLRAYCKESSNSDLLLEHFSHSFQ